MFRFLSTKIGLSLIVALIIIGSAAYIKLNKQNSREDLHAKISLIASESVQNAIKNGEIDTSGWEDVLEAISGSSTIDANIALIQEQAASSSTSQKPLTATDRFTRTFLSQYVELKESGATINEDTAVNLVNDLLIRDFGGPQWERVYSESDITIDLSNTPDLKKYGNILATAFATPVLKGYENELILLNRIYESGNTSDFRKLAQNEARYRDIRENIASIRPPKALVAPHIALLNSISAIIDGVKGMILIETDPVGATSLVLRYEDGLKGLDLATAQITSYFKKQKIVFSSTEPGSLFAE